ncbi:MAG: ethylbenzene dehydrogenase-related protein [Planctomycetota bacterium]|jgi:hypothetical protein
MRVSSFCLLLGLLAACDGERGTQEAPARSLPQLQARRLPDGQRVVLDGMLADPAWTAARDLPLDLDGKLTVHLKACYDDERLYLLATWSDPDLSMNRYWEYRGQVRWEKSTGEDGFAICWSPGRLHEQFREQGCAVFCHRGGADAGKRHVYPGKGTGYADFWYWGAQTTSFHAQARDMWLRRGDAHRLRGDPQPAESDNLLNHSDRTAGPRFMPKLVSARTARILLFDNIQELTPEWVRKYWQDEKNVGRQVPLDILRPRRGSRGDVAARARHYAGKGYILELSRALETRNLDDQPLGDLHANALFAVAIFVANGGVEHVVSGPVELRFLPAD